MSYAQGGLIEASDYNGFVASVNAIWGVGSSNSGYGQSTTLSTTSVSNTVTATQWANLIARIDSMRQHQSGVTSGLTQPVTGDLIEWLNTLSGQISTATNNRLFNNEGVTSTATALSSGTWGGNTEAIRECTFTFASANQMRYFFNTGGYVAFNAVNSAFSGGAKDINWDGIANSASTASVSSTNFYSLTTSYSAITSAGGAEYDYNLNVLYLEARLNASPGSSTVLYVRGRFYDGSSANTDEIVNGTARIDATAYASNTTYIANTWGTVTGTSNTVVTQS